MPEPECLISICDTLPCKSFPNICYDQLDLWKKETFCDNLPFKNKSISEDIKHLIICTSLEIKSKTFNDDLQWIKTSQSIQSHVFNGKDSISQLERAKISILNKTKITISRCASISQIHIAIDRSTRRFQITKCQMSSVQCQNAKNVKCNWNWRVMLNHIFYQFQFKELTL